METFVGSSSKASISFFSSSLQNLSGISSVRNSCFKFRNGYSSFVPISSNKLLFRSSSKRSFMVEAKKSNDKKNNKKADSHSFAPKPDEATGPFPEAVLLKEKKVQEDGRVLPEFADEEEEELFEFLNLQLESDLNVDQMRHYEVVYLIHQDYKEKVEDVNSKIQDFIREKKGRVWRFSDWGMRRLAYKIKKTTHAHYILMNFELEAQWINDFKQMLDQDERVIRHLVIKRDKAITEDCPPPPEFHTLRADMVDEYDVDEEEEDDEFYDEDEHDLEEYEEDDDADSEDISSKNVIKGTDNQKIDMNNTGKENLKREKALR
ncbi:30S ribosomal protein S6 [Bienertia sinuspersici]